jgi:hypothetical protein
MINLKDIVHAQDLLRGGSPPSHVLREFIASHPDTHVPELMGLLQASLALPYDRVQCVGGWWHDGSGELSDVQLDDLLRAAVSECIRLSW